MITTHPPKVYTATLTPLHKDLTVDYLMLTNHITWLLNAGSDGIALLGTTGEANSFDLKERKGMIEAVLKGGIDPSRLMVGTGSCAYTEAIKLTRFALKSDIKEILLLPPFYYKQVNEQGLMDFFSRVIEGVADDEMKVILYHFPKMSGINMTNAFVGKLIDKYPRQVVGMKDSSGDLEHMTSICEDFPGFRLFAGTEKFLLPVLRAGGAGCISATANVTIKMAARVLENWKQEKAHDYQEALTRVRSIFDGHPFSAVLKQYLAQETGNKNWLYMRPPNSALPLDTLQNLNRALIDLSFDMNE